MGSIFSAYKNQSPIVITAGQQSRALFPTVPFLFARDAPELPKPYVKWSCEPARAEDVPIAIAQAYRIALQPPYGPTFVSIPEDDWDRAGTPVPARATHGRFRAERAAVDSLVAALQSSARPALVVGAGVDRDDANDAARILAERIGAAVFVAPLSSRCSFSERHPNFAGFLPPVRTQIVERLRPYDLVAVLGAPVFTYHVLTSGPAIADGTVLYQLTDDPEAAASAAEGIAILTTLRETLEEIVDRLDVRPARPAPQPRPSLEDVAPADPMTGAFVLQMLACALPPNTIVLEEAPSHRSALHDRLPIERPGTFFAAASGSLGWALPAAVGAALARPGRRVVAILGDGSSMYSIQGLWTAKRFELPIVFVILNNRSYAAMDQFSRYLGFSGAPSFDLAGLDFVAAARTFGCAGVRIDRAADLAAAFDKAFAANAPIVIEVAVDDGADAIY
jgi:benzoylformate decarboxylase